MLYAVIFFLVVQRLLELRHSKANYQRLIEQGGYEVGANHYPIMVGIHVGWLAAMALFVDPSATANLVFVGLFGVLQLARYWVIRTLGGRWTTRVVIVPDAPLITTGPYRFFTHPNYIVVALEVLTVPMIFGAWQVAVVFGLLNGLILMWRIQIEEQGWREYFANA